MPNHTSRPHTDPDYTTARRHGQAAAIAWTNEAPVSLRFDDPYYALEDGLAEAEHVFLAGNDLPARFRPGFHVAELGFGTGLNALATARCWCQAGLAGRMKFTSFEAYPLSTDDMRRALARWPQLMDWSAPLLDAWTRGLPEARLPGLDLRIVPGDARQALPASDILADAWYLDGFSPARNPELWEADLLHAVRAHTRKGGTVATYSAAGDVRRRLQAVGFEVERMPGFGRKRHMTRGRLTDRSLK
jgi:tRNA U34 5-methylaminomethyl-2-thiouridine-forming methyltransferase MnmC